VALSIGIVKVYSQIYPLSVSILVCFGKGE